MNIKHAVIFAQALKLCPEWKAYKERWDCVRPRKGSKLWKAYVEESVALNAVLQKMTDDIVSNSEEAEE